MESIPLKYLQWSLLLLAIIAILCLLMFSTEDTLQRPRIPKDNPHTSFSFYKTWDMETNGGKTISVQDSQVTGISLNKNREPKSLTNTKMNGQNSQNYRDTPLSIHRNLKKIPSQNGYLKKSQHYHYTCTNCSSTAECFDLDSRKYNAENVQNDSGQNFYVSQTQDLVHKSLFYPSPAFSQYLSSRMTVTDELFKSRLNKNERQMLYEILQQLQVGYWVVNFKYTD